MLYSRKGLILRFFIENSTVLFLCKLKSLLPKTNTYQSEKNIKNYNSNKILYLKLLLKNIMISILGNCIVEEGSIFMHWIISNTIFRNIPFFFKQNWITNPLSLKALQQWSMGNAYLSVIGGFFLGIIETHLPKSTKEELDNNQFSIKQFIWKFSIVRAIVDVTFYLAHKILHINPTIYKLIHKRHHEHYTTNLTYRI